MTVPSETNSTIRPTVFTNKNFVLSGVTLYTDEFSIIKNSSSMTESVTNRLIAVRYLFVHIYSKYKNFALFRIVWWQVY
jgi:hypothetical protein